ncbi:hypothetical protein [Pseudorhodobacter wandonensis]|uniref:hypothetical protein n=1 Tax=Pseudorhodobacter wandonensis TaxID=1120568 RepID=UPI00067CF615|nr:hypothetical protein [Pseudorhodobacter wandonensis]
MTSTMNAALDDALRGISFAWQDGDRHYAVLPVQYPSGALCTLEINLGRDVAHISDMAAGHKESSTLCEDTAFGKIAHAEAKKRGLIFKDGTFLVREVDRGMLPAALVAIANASVSAAHAAIRHDSERREEARNDAIFDKVSRAFPNAHVHRTLEVSGSRAQWGVHNVVDLRDNRKAIFEPVSMHVISVSAKFTMFSDLAPRRELALNAVFADTKHLDPKAQMLSEVANIIGIDDAMESYRQRAS